MSKIAVIFSIILLSSCINPKRNTESAFSLEGTWTCDDTYYRLYPDGTGVVGDSIENDSIVSWKFADGILSYSVEENPSEKVNINISIRSDNTVVVDQSFSFRKEDDI